MGEFKFRFEEYSKVFHETRLSFVFAFVILILVIKQQQKTNDAMNYFRLARN